MTRAFPPEMVDAAVEEAGARELRRRRLPARLVVYFTLALWLFRGRNCGYGQVMAKLADGLGYQYRAADLLGGQLDAGGLADAGHGGRWRQPNISSMARGRGKLGPGPLRNLFLRVAGPTGELGDPGVSCCGLRVVSVGGSVTDVPGSPANAGHFGQADDGAFPQVRWVVAAESGTGSLLGAAIGPSTSAERALALDLLGCLGPGQLVLAGRDFLSWSLARDVLATGARILWRAPASANLEPVKVLADGTRLAELRPPRKQDGPPVTVRVIEYTVRPASGARTARQVFRLVTDLLDPGEYPALDLASRYPRRWRCERVIGRHQADMGEGQPVLRSKDPDGAVQEMWALFAVYQALCDIIGTGAAPGVPPERISFALPQPGAQVRR